MKVVFVHCHPDDETITTGGTIAKFINMGHDVTVINFSNGMSGNSYLDEYPAGTDKFKNKLLEEHSKAMQALGVSNHIFIGPYDDTIPGKTPIKGSLKFAGIETLSKQLYDILLLIKPDLLITYDKDGWSGHPDHIAVNNATIHSINILDNTYKIPNIWFTVIKSENNTIGFMKNGQKDLFWVSSYLKVDLEIDFSNVIDKRINALKAYETQIKLYDDYWTLVGMDSYKVPIFTKEYFNIYRGTSDYKQI
jgi:N-acetyl-1-D-myo-inositol-2-amino-2-deoxy-alpha-D-glucopyranoside deacetylase